MKRILVISVVLVYVKASRYSAGSGTSDLKVTSYPDPENIGGEEHTPPARENLGGEEHTPPARENVTEQSTNQTAGNVTEQCTNQTAAYDQIVRLTNCSVPRVPENGGLVCVYFDDIYYCKPMCNPGYDFAFLRRSRLYEECGIKTAFTWTTQYIGGSRLAECIASEVLVSGQPSAYFSQEECLQVVCSRRRKQEYIDEFINELDKRGIRKHHRKELEFVTCGK